MIELMALVPLIPLLSSIILMVCGTKLSRLSIGILGVGSVGIAALITANIGVEFLINPEIYTVSLWTWMEVGNFSPGISFYFDGLTNVLQISSKVFIYSGLSLLAVTTGVSISITGLWWRKRKYLGETLQAL